MIQFTYSFCMALLHSFWQAALIVLLYLFVANVLHRNHAPLAKRNFLYTALTFQLALFAITFLLYLFNTPATGNLPGMLQNMAERMSQSSFQMITPWIFSVYMCFIAFKLAKAIYTWYHFKQLYMSGLQKPSVEIKLFTMLKAHQFGIKRKVTIWLSQSINTPVTFGFFKPVILLPVSLVNNISIQQAETLILHELAHIRTHDYLLNWFLLTAETIFFFNPFVLSLCKHIRLEREKNCDLQVISFEYSPALYAETLLQAEMMKKQVLQFQLAAVSSKKYLLQRIRYFSNEKINHQKLRYNIVAPLLGLTLLILLSIAVLFQSGKTSKGRSANEIAFFPFNNHIITDADFVNLNTTDIKAMQSTALYNEQLKPVIKNGVIPMEKQAGKQYPVKSGEKVSNPVAESTPADMGIAVPVALWENDASRQIIIKEESSGAASVKVYFLQFEDGKWILKPEWAITAKEIINDSLSVKIDSLDKNVRRIIPAQQ
jgi:beta-lactamase regulating signal transducer with metallopeptidase domain